MYSFSNTITFARWGLLLGVVWSLFSTQFTLAQSQPITVGYRDHYYGNSVDSEPTGEKPQSKLWWNDGLWWASLWHLEERSYMIYRFDMAYQSWQSTGTRIDERSDSKSDALWDGERLYIASHFFSRHDQGPTSNLERVGRLYRYSYDQGTQTYSLDNDFPVLVNRSLSEALVIAKDSTGKLWITWMEKGKVMINCSQENDRRWGEPFQLPVQGFDADDDDLASIVHFGGNKLGVLWSNQSAMKFYFAVHSDGDPDEAWQDREVALADENLGAVADDHINLAYDSDGFVYAITKTSLGGDDAPRVFLLRRDPIGNWSHYYYGSSEDKHTRPIVLVDSQNRKIYVFARSTTDGRPAIYMKSTNMDHIEFKDGLGVPFIKSAERTDREINNPTSTKQCLDGDTDLLVLASDEKKRHYFHNTLDLAGGAPNEEPISFQPVADTYVKSTLPSTNFGSEPFIRLKTSYHNYHGYLKFDVTGVVSRIKSATLRLYTDSAGPDGGSVYAVSNHYQGTSSPWQEAELNWDNAPAITGSPLSAVSKVTTGTWVDFNVTAAITGSGVYSFGMISDTTESTYYSSRESAFPPELVIRFDQSNQSPVALNDTAILNEDTVVTIDVLANDGDADGVIDPASVAIVDSASNGAITEIDASTGQISYQPHPNYFGSDSITYTVNDDEGATSNRAGVAIIVNSVNDAPIANDDTARVYLNAKTRIDLVSNDIDIEGALDLTSIEIIDPPRKGNVTIIEASGWVEYKPYFNFIGSDSFAYTIEDDEGLPSNIATVTVVVSNVVRKPRSLE